MFIVQCIYLKSFFPPVCAVWSLRQQHGEDFNPNADHCSSVARLSLSLFVYIPSCACKASERCCTVNNAWREVPCHSQTTWNWGRWASSSLCLLAMSPSFAFRWGFEGKAWEQRLLSAPQPGTLMPCSSPQPLEPFQGGLVQPYKGQAVWYCTRWFFTPHLCTTSPVEAATPRGWRFLFPNPSPV